MVARRATGWQQGGPAGTGPQLARHDPGDRPGLVRGILAGRRVDASLHGPAAAAGRLRDCGAAARGPCLCHRGRRLQRRRRLPPPAAHRRADPPAARRSRRCCAAAIPATWPPSWWTGWRRWMGSMPAGSLLPASPSPGRSWCCCGPVGRPVRRAGAAAGGRCWCPSAWRSAGIGAAAACRQPVPGAGTVAGPLPRSGARHRHHRPARAAPNPRRGRWRRRRRTARPHHAGAARRVPVLRHAGPCRRRRAGRAGDPLRPGAAGRATSAQPGLALFVPAAGARVLRAAAQLLRRLPGPAARHRRRRIADRRCRPPRRLRRPARSAQSPPRA